MSNVFGVGAMGNMFVVVSVEHESRMVGQTIKRSDCISIPIVFNTLDEAEEWCEKVKVRGRDYLIFGTWNPKESETE